MLQRKSVNRETLQQAVNKLSLSSKQVEQREHTSGH